MAPNGPRPRAQQPLVIRLTHWLNLPLLLIMCGSGLQIFAAFPALGPRGALYRWYPLQHHAAPSWLTLGGWLAGARHWHFAFAWLFVLNGAIYVAYFCASGEWRRRLFFPLRDGGNALRTIAYYLRVRKEPPPQGLYNGLQRLTYSGALILAVASVLSGLALYKPVQLRWATVMMGGYDAGRSVHLLALAALALFTIVHVVLVALHPRALVDMITGGRRRE